MRIDLGTIEISDREREAISRFYGEKKSGRITCRNYILDNGLTSIEDQLALLEADENKDS